MEKNGVTLLIDPMSYQYWVGAEIDYQEGLEGAQFVIKNPNAQEHLRLRVVVLGLGNPGSIRNSTVGAFFIASRAGRGAVR